MLDTYQARLTEALSDLEIADRNDFAIRRAEHVALAEGYFAILSAAYREQRGPEALAVAQQALADLRAAAYTGENLTATLERSKRPFTISALHPSALKNSHGGLVNCCVTCRWCRLNTNEA